MSIPEALKGAKVELTSIGSPVRRYVRAAQIGSILAKELLGTLALAPYGYRAWSLYRSLPDPKTAARMKCQNRVMLMRDVRYGAKQRNVMDIYLPPTTGIEYHADRQTLTHKLHPVTLFCHGGVWSAGDKWHYSPMASRLAQAGVVVCVMHYTLYPEALITEMVAEVSAALTWVMTNIRDMGGNKDEVSLVGHSAGAHLVALCLLHRAATAYAAQQAQQARADTSQQTALDSSDETPGVFYDAGEFEEASTITFSSSTAASQSRSGLWGSPSTRGERAVQTTSSNNGRKVLAKVALPAGIKESSSAYDVADDAPMLSSTSWAIGVESGRGAEACSSTPVSTSSANTTATSDHDSTYSSYNQPSTGFTNGISPGEDYLSSRNHALQKGKAKVCHAEAPARNSDEREASGTGVESNQGDLTARIYTSKGAGDTPSTSALSSPSTSSHSKWLWSTATSTASTTLLDNSFTDASTSYDPSSITRSRAEPNTTTHPCDDATGCGGTSSELADNNKSTGFLGKNVGSSSRSRSIGRSLDDGSIRQDYENLNRGRNENCSTLEGSRPAGCSDAGWDGSESSSTAGTGRRSAPISAPVGQKVPLPSSHVMPKQAVLVCGVYDISKHYEYEKQRGVHMLSTMERVMGGRELFAAGSPSVILEQTFLRSRQSQEQTTQEGAVAQQHPGVQEGATDFFGSFELAGDAIATRIGLHRASSDCQVLSQPQSAGVMDLPLEATQSIPPIVLMSSCTDVTVPWYESAEMYWRLRDVGVPAAHLLYNKVGHGDFVVDWPSPQFDHMDLDSPTPPKLERLMQDLPAFAQDLTKIVVGSAKVRFAKGMRD